MSRLAACLIFGLSLLIGGSAFGWQDDSNQLFPTSLSQAIDNDAKLAGMPTIVLSSRTEADLVRKTRASGGCYFISKPYDPNVLLAIIERALGTELQ